MHSCDRRLYRSQRTEADITCSLLYRRIHADVTVETTKAQPPTTLLHAHVVPPRDT